MRDARWAIMKKTQTAKPSDTPTTELTIHCKYDELQPVKALLKKLNPDNPNKHPGKQLELYGKILKVQGVRSAVVISIQSGLVVKGHGLILACDLLGVAELPVDRQTFETPALEKSHMLADNRLAELAELDYGAVSKILKGLPEGFDMELSGFWSHELENLLAADWNPAQVEALPGEHNSKGLTIVFDQKQKVIVERAIKADRKTMKKVDGEPPSDADVLVNICRHFVGSHK